MRWIGESAQRIEVPSGTDRRALLASLKSDPRVIDAVVTEEHACVLLDPARADSFVFPSVTRTSIPSVSTREHRVVVSYDGEDLAEVARATGLAKGDIIRLHSSRAYEVKWLGFLPGFAYLDGVDEALRLPRKKTPRVRVPPGSVAIADRYTGIYPYASPGGWNILGSTRESVFDASGARFQVGDIVRFVRHD